MKWQAKLIWQVGGVDLGKISGNFWKIFWFAFIVVHFIGFRSVDAGQLNLDFYFFTTNTGSNLFICKFLQTTTNTTNVKNVQTVKKSFNASDFFSFCISCPTTVNHLLKDQKPLIFRSLKNVYLGKLWLWSWKFIDGLLAWFLKSNIYFGFMKIKNHSLEKKNRKWIMVINHELKERTKKLVLVFKF